MVFSGTATKYLAERICQSLGCPLGKMVMTKFSDGEFAVSYEQSVRGRDLFLVQSTFPNSDNLMELLLMIDAAKRASAKSINAVIPYFGWARQDRKDKPRVSIGAKLVADLLSVAGVDRVITMDLHADQIQGFFDVPVDHLYASGVILPYLISLKLDEMVIASPDVGGSKRANTYANGQHPLHTALCQGEATERGRHVCRHHPPRGREQEHQRPVHHLTSVDWS